VGSRKASSLLGISEVAREMRSCSSNYQCPDAKTILKHPSSPLFRNEDGL